MTVHVVTIYMQRSTSGCNCLEDGGNDALALVDYGYYSMYLHGLMSQLFERPHVKDGCPSFPDWEPER